MNKLNRINEDPVFFNLIDYEEDNIRMMNSKIEAAIEKGLKEGLEQGIEQGIIKVAKNLIKNGMSLEEVSKNTGLSLKKIRDLQLH